MVVLVSASSSNFTGQGILQQLGIQGLPDRGPINNLPIFSVTGFCQRQHQPAQPGQRRPCAAGRQPQLGARPPHHEVRPGTRSTSSSTATCRIRPESRSSAASPSPANSPATPTPISCSDCPPRSRAWSPSPPSTTASATGPATPRTISKSRRKLTLMYGLRWEYNGPAYTLNDNLYSFDLATGKIVVPNQAALKLFSPYFPTTFPVEDRRPDRHRPLPAQGGQEQLRAALRLLLSVGQRGQDGAPRRLGNLLLSLLGQRPRRSFPRTVCRHHGVHQQHRQRRRRR